MKRTPNYFYFVNCGSAYRAPVKISKKQKALGQFSIVKPPQVFTPEGWTESLRFKGIEGIDAFTANIEAGAIKRVSLLNAAAHVDGDIVLFAPTFSSRIASKRI